MEEGTVICNATFGYEDVPFPSSGFVVVTNWCTSLHSHEVWFSSEELAIQELKRIASDAGRKVYRYPGYYPSVDLTLYGCRESSAFIRSAEKYYEYERNVVL